MLRGGGNSSPVGGMGNLAEGVILTIRIFSKLKATFCKYWTLGKIKISMIFLYIEHKVKIKMVYTGATVTTAQNQVFIES